MSAKQTPESNGKTPERQRRSQVKRELDALGELVQLLKPLTPEQREKLFRTAQVMLQ